MMDCYTEHEIPPPNTFESLGHQLSKPNTIPHTWTSFTQSTNMLYQNLLQKHCLGRQDKICAVCWEVFRFGGGGGVMHGKAVEERPKQRIMVTKQ